MGHMLWLAGGTYRWPGLDEPKGENPFLRLFSVPLAFTVVFVGQSIETKDILLFIGVRRKVGEQKVKE